MSTDPVCGMEVYESMAPTTVHQGVTYHFCSQACLGAFQDDPGSYVQDDAKRRLRDAA
jgi:YHS domain-containing protein